MFAPPVAAFAAGKAVLLPAGESQTAEVAGPPSGGKRQAGSGAEGSPGSAFASLLQVLLGSIGGAPVPAAPAALAATADPSARPAAGSVPAKAAGTPPGGAPASTASQTAVTPPGPGDHLDGAAAASPAQPAQTVAAGAGAGEKLGETQVQGGNSFAAPAVTTDLHPKTLAEDQATGAAGPRSVPRPPEAANGRAPVSARVPIPAARRLEVGAGAEFPEPAVHVPAAPGVPSPAVLAGAAAIPPRQTGDNGSSPRPEGAELRPAPAAGDGRPAVLPPGPSADRAAAPADRPAAAPAPEQLAAAVTARALLVRRGETTEFYVRLEPPELGTVHVHLQATGRGVTARLVVSSDADRAAVEGQLPALRSRLDAAGVTLGGLDVSQRQAGSGQAGGRQADRSAGPPGRAAAESLPPAPPGGVSSGAGVGIVNVIA